MTLKTFQAGQPFKFQMTVTVTITPARELTVDVDEMGDFANSIMIEKKRDFCKDAYDAVALALVEQGVDMALTSLDVK